jgi:S-formylglutathione hydrolase FrmB
VTGSALIMLRWTIVVATSLVISQSASAFIDVFRLCTSQRFQQLNRELAGQVLDFTNNHSQDRRIYSPALGEKRDLYIYLPPGYDPKQHYPAMLWLHGLGYDEKNFLDIVPIFDRAVRASLLPPMIIVAVDGTINGKPSLFNSGSFYVNGRRGNFEDSTIQDMWGFAKKYFPIRPERDAHVIAGASMGGFGAFNLGFKYRQEFGHLCGILPPLNMRYGDATGRYLVDYDPKNFALRPVDRRNEVVGIFYSVIWIRNRRVLDPILGRRPISDPTQAVSLENPYEMIDRLQIRPDEFKMFIGYGKKDEFNMDAQVESFLAKIQPMGFKPTVYVAPEGRHNIKTAATFFPGFCAWLQTSMSQYTPKGYVPPAPLPRTEPLATIRRTGVLGLRSIPIPTGLPYFGLMQNHQFLPSAIGPSR